MSDLVELRSLVAVVEAGSIAGAAARVGYSASAVSRHIATLERRFAVTLLRRGARSSSPTVAARRLVTQARIVIEEEDALLAEVSTMRDGAEGALRFAYTRAAATVVVPRALALLRDTHPGIRVSLHESDLDDDVVLALDRGEADVGLVWGFPDHPSPALDTAPLLSEHLVLVTSDQRPELHQDPVDLAAIAREPHTTTIGNRGTPPLVDRIFTSAGLPAPQRIYPIADHAQLHGIVRAGLAVALLPSLGVIDIESGVMRSVIREDFRRILLAWPRGESGPPTRAALIRAIAAAAKAIDSPFVRYVGP